MIYEMLERGKHRGRQNAATKNELRAATGIESERTLRKIIAEERKNGKLILSDTKDGGGYYLPSSRAEIQAFIDSMQHRAGNTFMAIKAAKEELKQIEDQTVLEFTE